MLDEKTKIKEYNLRDAERDNLGGASNTTMPVPSIRSFIPLAKFLQSARLMKRQRF